MHALPYYQVKADGDSCPSSFYCRKEFVNITGWEAGWNLDLVWTWFLMGKFLSLPDHAFRNHSVS
jgi:hypothetical protein